MHAGRDASLTWIYLARLLQRDIQLDVFDGWIYVKMSGLWVLLCRWSGFIIPNVKFQYNKKFNQWETHQET